MHSQEKCADEFLLKRHVYVADVVPQNNMSAFFACVLIALLITL